MTSESLAPTLTTRRRLFLSALVVMGALMVPAILVPTALLLLREPAFHSLQELDPGQIVKLEVFVLNRPDQLPDIGSTKGMRVIPAEGQQRVLDFLRNAQPVDSSRAIFLGRLVVQLRTGEREQLILNRFGDSKSGYRLRYFIGQQGYDAASVNDFTRLLDEVLGSTP